MYLRLDRCVRSGGAYRARPTLPVWDGFALETTMPAYGIRSIDCTSRHYPVAQFGLDVVDRVVERLDAAANSTAATRGLGAIIKKSLPKAERREGYYTRRVLALCTQRDRPGCDTGPKRQCSLQLNSMRRGGVLKAGCELPIVDAGLGQALLLKRLSMMGTSC